MADDSADEAELRFRAAVSLGFVIGRLVDFVLELGGDSAALEDLVLAVGEVGFEAEFADGEGEDERFPGDGGSVEGGCETAEEVHDSLIGVVIGVVEGWMWWAGRLETGVREVRSSCTGGGGGLNSCCALGHPLSSPNTEDAFRARKHPSNSFPVRIMCNACDMNIQKEYLAPSATNSKRRKTIGSTDRHSRVPPTNHLSRCQLANVTLRLPHRAPALRGGRMWKIWAAMRMRVLPR